MDTMLLCNDKRILNVFGIAVNFLIITALVAAQSAFVPIMARDMLANVPVLDTGQKSIEIMREVKDEVKSRNFDEEVRQKYPNALIADIDSGVKHIKMTKYYDGRPVKINVVVVNPELAKDYTLTPALASDTLSNKSTITSIAKNTNSIIALNGTYFKPQTGVPLGTLMINEKLYTGPIYDRVAMGIFDDGYDIARVQLNASFGTGKNTVKVDNVNQPRMLSTYVLAYTPDWGNLAAPTPKYGLQIAVSDNKITQISTSRLNIPKDGYVIAGPSSILGEFKVGDRVKLDVNTIPEWKNVKHIISGGPYLVKNNEVFVDMTAQKLGAIGGKNPRSAIGYTADNHLILVAVDGREGSSVGLTLMQLANFMKSAGCVNAMNLDGGGSTVMYVNGKVVNNPQVKGGIALSNAIVLTKKS